jgi:putative SOS response-associated peptidase YedK
MLRWGLVPSWEDSSTVGVRMTHARAETVATQRAFPEAFRHRRCLIVVDSFYLSRHVIQMADDRPFGVAAIWERWRRDELLESCAVITTDANELVRVINDRMPAIIATLDRHTRLGAQRHTATSRQPLRLLSTNRIATQGNRKNRITQPLTNAMPQ